MNNKIVLPLMISLAVGVSACKNLDIKNEYPKTAYEKRLEKSGSILTQSHEPFNLMKNNLAFGKGKKDKENHNHHNGGSDLYKAALDTISFMPLASVDSVNKIIITDWHSSAEAPQERYKFYIKAEATSSLEVKLYKQHKVNGDWQDMPVNSKLVDQVRQNIISKVNAQK